MLCLSHSAGYQWSDGSPVTHTNWAPGEPNNHEGREECVEMVTTANGTSWWNDLNCDAHQDWICMIAKGQTPILPPVPPPPVPGQHWRHTQALCKPPQTTRSLKEPTSQHSSGT